MQVRGRWYYMQQMIPQVIGAANHDVTHVCGTTGITCNRSWRHTCVCGTTMSCATSPIDVTHVCVVPQKLCATNHDVTHVCVVLQILCATNHDVTHARQIMTSGMWMLPLMMSCAAIIIIIYCRFYRPESNAKVSREKFGSFSPCRKLESNYKATNYHHVTRALSPREKPERKLVDKAQKHFTHSVMSQSFFFFFFFSHYLAGRPVI